METLLIGTNIVSYLFKRDTRAVAYEPILADHRLAVSFATRRYALPVVTHNPKHFRDLPGIEVRSTVRES
jgi:hypothetical protein